MKIIVLLMVAAVVLATGCTTGNIAVDDQDTQATQAKEQEEKQAREQAKILLKEEVNSLQTLELNVSNSLSKATLKLGSLISNDLSSDPQIELAEKDVQTLDAENEKSMSALQSMRGIINSWNDREPTNESGKFIDIYSGYLDDLEEMLEESSATSDLYKKYISYRKDDSKLRKLSEEISKDANEMYELLNKYDYHGAFGKADKIINETDEKINILRRQVNNPDVQISVDKKILERQQLLKQFAVQMKLGFDRLIRTPAMSYDFAFKEANEIDEKLKNLTISDSEINDAYTKWKNDNIATDVSKISNVQLDASSKYLNAYRYLETNQDKTMILNGTSVVMAKIL